MPTPSKNVRFPKFHRLLVAKQFQHVFNKVECKQSGRYFTLLSRTNELKHSRLGLVIAKKHAPKAVTRNTIKRVVRENFRHAEYDTLQPRHHFDTIVLAKPNINKLSSMELHREITHQWQRLNKKQHAFLAE